MALIGCIALTNCKSSDKNISGTHTLLDENRSEVALHVLTVGTSFTFMVRP